MAVEEACQGNLCLATSVGFLSLQTSPIAAKVPAHLYLADQIVVDSAADFCSDFDSVDFVQAFHLNL